MEQAMRREVQSTSLGTEEDCSDVLGAGVMARIALDDVIYSERAEDKLRGHGIVPRPLIEAISSQNYRIERNRADRAAPYILYGRDAQGRCIASPIVPTHDPRVWETITAWYCKPAVAAKLNRTR
jgi:hypothetical protein